MENVRDLISIFEKKNVIMRLIDEIKYPVILEYFDFESDKDLDKKIKILKQVKSGKSISEIEGFWDILELYPGEGVVI